MKKFLIFFYSIFLLSFAIFSYFFVDPNLFYLKDIYSGFAFSNRFLSTTLYVFFITIFFIFYGIFVWLGHKRAIKLKEVLILIGITCGILFFSYPAILSYDIFNYILTSKVLFFYHENPYIIMPIEFVGDPYLLFTHAANKTALYGPIWIIFTAIPHFLGFGNFILTLFSFKLFVSIFYLATLFIVWKISKNINYIILFFLNPLVLVETLISGHNDIVMMFFAILSFYFLKNKKVFFAVLSIIISILIKYATIFLIPLFIYSSWKVIKKKEINLNNTFYYSSFMMYFVFLISPIREEIYPWYAIWFLSFVFLIPENKLLLKISIILSFCLLFRYVPYMFSGTYGNLTPIIKTALTFIPVFFFLIFIMVKKLWQRILYR